MSKTASQVLSGAADLIEKAPKLYRNWFWGKLDGETCYCALGAIRVAAGGGGGGVITMEGHKVYREATRALGAVIKDSVPDWNDHPDRTKEEVVQALRTASELIV